jgi:GNAT superfamily N-acetyltransferase
MAQAVGLAWARIDPSEPGVARLYQMWVAPGSRRGGVGRALLGAAIAWARGKGATSMYLSATCGETPAARLYARAGFVAAGDPEPIRPGSEVLAQLLRLELRAA